MLTSRTPMKRTGFKRRELPHAAHQDRDQRLAERAARAASSARATAALVPPSTNAQCSATPAPPIEKESPLRSEPYRRLVAALPCANCGIAGYSQHAHENDGKGKGMKVDDRRAMPLCCTRPGIEGCHVAFDQYRLLPGGREAHHAQGHAWSEQTRTRIYESGQWPKKLPLWKD